jgi:hypothetical protein
MFTAMFSTAGTALMARCMRSWFIRLLSSSAIFGLPDLRVHAEPFFSIFVFKGGHDPS